MDRQARAAWVSGWTGGRMGKGGYLGSLAVSVLFCYFSRTAFLRPAPGSWGEVIQNSGARGSLQHPEHQQSQRLLLAASPRRPLLALPSLQEDGAGPRGHRPLPAGPACRHSPARGWASGSPPPKSQVCPPWSCQQMPHPWHCDL